MHCPKCHSENSQTNNFCRKCGEKLLLTCPQCSSEYLPDDLFCSKCGHKLAGVAVKEKPIPPSDSERKHVTVMFSDMSGYTAMTEKLDPEEVKEIMGKVFGEISKVLSRYEGFIEKFIGDAVMALFGVPKSHEDDPVRAIKAARDIHDIVSTISPQYEKRIGKPLVMHTGICTGLVVTGEVNLEKGTYGGVLGDTINTAARLTGLAKPGEIVIGHDTYYQAEGYFTFEPMEPTAVKGKAEPIRFYKVLSAKEDPTKTHRLSGMRADLIGRKVEMSQLQEAVTNLRQGKGSIFSIMGDAGTGKSRLIEEFKASLDLNTIQWREGHCYAYAHNIPYFPLMDLFSRAWWIEEGDSPEKIRQKIESGVRNLVGDEKDVIPYIGSLYSLKYPEIEGIEADYGKVKLHAGVKSILIALCRMAPTIICIEDLHWADPSSVELLRFILSDFRIPALFICAYRPEFSLFTSHQITGLIKLYHEIKLQDLSTSEAQTMVESLLETEIVPPDLRKFIQSKVEGNPFYLEEVINSLLETAILVKEGGKWFLTKPLTEANVPSTVQGVLSARLDRLEKEGKRILQEASVIGRSFFYEILKRITELKEHIDRSLTGLERLDLIRIRSIQPELEYIFKHAMTQEVVYNGLLKKERHAIHERIGCVIEEIFKDRLPEFYEVLAFHFKQGTSVIKAVKYLMKSGEKSVQIYALEESHKYYEDAFEILSSIPERTSAENELLIDLVIMWGFVYYYRGDFRGMSELFYAHEDLATSLADKAKLGMFYAWLGFSLWPREKLKDSYHYLHKALELGEEIDDKQVIGYACCWLPWICAELGLLEESVAHGKRAQEISKLFQSNHYLHFKSLAGIAYAYFFSGKSKAAFGVGKSLLEYGQQHHNLRSISLGQSSMAYGPLMAGDYPSAIEYLKKSIQTKADPIYTQAAKTLLGMSYVQCNLFSEAEEVLQDVVNYNRDFGCEWLARPATATLGVVFIAKGSMSQGLKMIEEAQQSFQQSGRKYFATLMQYIRGRVYFQIVEGAGPITMSMVVKNIAFLAKNVPVAGKKAEAHLEKSIEMAKEIGAKGLMGQAYLDLGLLHKAKKRTDKAREYLSEAVTLFEECEADVFLKQAKEALAALG